jgi:hypothetical protein
MDTLLRLARGLNETVLPRMAPHGQQFLLLRPAVAAAPGSKVELVQTTDWTPEVRSEMAGTVQRPAMPNNGRFRVCPPPAAT